VYGGAGVHVEYLSPGAGRLVDVGCTASAPRADPLVAGAYEPWDALAQDGKGRGAAGHGGRSLRMAADVGGADLVHSHTWYANLRRLPGQAPLRRAPRDDRPQPRASAAPGRPSNWAPATACRRGWSARPSRAPTP
jgi:hypothetical protein